MTAVAQPEEKRLTWSRDGEYYQYDSLCDLLDTYDDLRVGDVVHVGEVEEVPLHWLCDADDIIDMMGDRAYDNVGEAADDYPNVSPEAKAELESLITGWIEKHAKPTFYRVEKAREHVLTSEDMEGREQ